MNSISQYVVLGGTEVHVRNTKCPYLGVDLCKFIWAFIRDLARLSDVRILGVQHRGSIVQVLGGCG